VGIYLNRFGVFVLGRPSGLGDFMDDALKGQLQRLGITTEKEFDQLKKDWGKFLCSGCLYGFNLFRCHGNIIMPKGQLERIKKTQSCTAFVLQTERPG